MSTRKPPTTMTRLKGVRNPPPIRRRPVSMVRVCPNTSCTDPHIEDVDDKRVCTACGTVVSDSNIVSEVQFGETSTGAAVVQGSYIGADQSHARTTETGFRRGGGMDSREITDANGKRYINQLAAALHIPPATADMAFQVYKLAACHNFIQGRRTKNVAAVALYIACRKQKRNSFMLIDFSDVLNVNVFKLGQTFKDFSKECQILGFEPILPENLVYRFATKLEFGRMTEQVAQDAARLVQRMDRDWMTTGRRPSGICGACLILAARMNNFRRTVREVVYVVKVADMTINKRLEEFKCTESSSLTVEQFRIINLEKGHDPPAFYEQKTEKKKRKRTRQGEEEAGEVENEEDQTAASASGTADPAQEPLPTPAPSSEVRRDKDGFAIPDIPIDPTLLAASASALSELNWTPPPTDPTSEEPPKKRPRGRPRKDDPTRPQVPEPTAADLMVEAALETEISQLLSDPSTQSHAEAYSVAQTMASALVAGQVNSTISMNAEIADSEFADDPEVSNCVLSPAEQEIKERIWVHENQDYLRDQQRKMLLKQMEERNGTKKVVRKRKRKGRIGEGGDGSVASSPAEATMDMLRRRGFSRKINYGVIERMFDGSSRRASREGSVAATPSSTASTTNEDHHQAATAEKTADTKPTSNVEDDDDGNDNDNNEVADEEEQMTSHELVAQDEDEDMVDEAIDDAVEESLQEAYGE